MVVVGVLARSDDTTISLVLNGPVKSKFNFTDVATNLAYVYDVAYDKNRTIERYVYRWFNWFAIDFTLTLT